MSDDKTKRGGRDRERVAGGEDYEVRHFAKKYGISADRAKELIRQQGNHPDKLQAAAAKLSRT